MEKINLDDFLDKLCGKAIDSMGEREIAISRNFTQNLAIGMDRGILEKSFLGILKNAIENTPDEGEIEITASSKNGEICIEIRDHGVGITEQNKKMIFGGFFHTQEADHYSTKRPYAFDAGGTGSDLLRKKPFPNDSASRWTLRARAVDSFPLIRTDIPGRFLPARLSGISRNAFPPAGAPSLSYSLP